MREVAGYILAGGKAKRFNGADKMLLKWKGKTFGDYLLESLDELECVYVSVAKKPENISRAVRYVEDIYQDTGPVGGILSGLIQCPQDALLVVPCDAPGIDKKLTDSMLNEYKKNGMPVFFRLEGRVHPFPAIYTKAMLPVLEKMIQSGEYKLRSFFNMKEMVSCNVLDFRQNEISLYNINSEAEYRKMLEETRGKGGDCQMDNTVTLGEAEKLLGRYISDLQKTENIGLSMAGGRILAAAVTADTDQPPFAKSPMDGYAVRSQDIESASRENPVVLNVIEKVYAGQYPFLGVKQGEAVRIMTGAPIPDGADTVVRQEDTDYGKESVKVYKSQKKHVFYCPQGEDFKRGDVLIKQGSRLDAVRIGIVAGAGLSSVSVKCKIRAAVLTTGCELCQPGQQLKRGQIYNTGLYIITQRLREWGVEPVLCKALPDDDIVLGEAIEEAAAKTDLIITTGGVSVGEKDIVKAVLKGMGANIIFDRIKIKPGSPSSFSMYKGYPVVSLSGNPFAMMVHMELLVRRAVSLLYGSEEMLPVLEEVELLNDFPKKSFNERCVRGRVQGGRVWIPVNKEKPGILSSMENCNCLVRIPGQGKEMKKGEKVWIQRL